MRCFERAVTSAEGRTHTMLYMINCYAYCWVKPLFFNRKLSDIELVPGTIIGCGHCGLAQFRSSVSYGWGCVSSASHLDFRFPFRFLS